MRRSATRDTLPPARGAGHRRWIAALLVLVGASMVASCRGERVRLSPVQAEVSEEPDASLDTDLCSAAPEPPSESPAVVCYTLEESRLDATLALLAIDLDGGGVTRLRTWRLPADAGPPAFGVSGLAFDGARFVTTANQLSASESGLYVLSLSEPVATHRALPSTQLPVIAWTGHDWIAELPEPEGVARFPSLEAVGDGWPMWPLARQISLRTRRLSVAGRRLYDGAPHHLRTGASEVSVYDVCSGTPLETLALEGPPVDVEAISVVGNTLHALESRGDGASAMLRFGLDGGARLGGLDFPGRAAGLHCTSEPLVTLGAGVDPEPYSPAVCPAATSARGVGEVTCFALDASGDGGTNAPTLVAFDVASPSVRPMGRYSLDNSPPGPALHRTLGFDGTSFLTSAQSAGVTVWHRLSPHDGGASLLGWYGTASDESSDVGWTGMGWLVGYGASEGVTGVGLVPHPGAVVLHSPERRVTASTYESFTGAEGLLYGLREGHLEIREVCTGALVRTLPWPLPVGQTESLSFARGALYALTTGEGARALVTVALDGGTQHVITEVAAGVSGLACAPTSP